MAVRVLNFPSFRNDCDDKTTNLHDDDVKCLITERDKLRNELDSCRQLNHLLRKIIKLKLEAQLTDTTQNGAIVDQLNEIVWYSGIQNKEQTKFFRISYPKSQSCGNRPLICKGCNRNFDLIKNCTIAARSRVYTRHCIKECDKYQALGLIGHCSKCKLSFTNQTARTRHINTCHQQDMTQIKPRWMSNQLFRWTVRMMIFDTDVICKGCNKTFKGGKHRGSQRTLYEFDYYVHCIEQCEEYKKLNLIHKCESCNLKFLDSKDMSIHSVSKHKESGNQKRRSWMNSSMLHRIHSEEFNTTVNCKGCGKLFKAQKSGTHFSSETDYYIHCVEECVDFQKLNLIQKCPKCNKIFITKIGFTMHVRGCISS